MGERAQLLRKLDVLQSKLAGAERRLAEAKAHRLSLREEIGLSLDSTRACSSWRHFVRRHSRRRRKWSCRRAERGFL